MAVFLCTDPVVGQNGDGMVRASNISSTFIGTDPLTSDLIYVNSSVHRNTRGLQSFLLQTDKAGLTVDAASIEQVSKLYVESFQRNIGVEIGPQNLNLEKTHVSADGSTHLTFQQLIHGIPVRGGDVKVHFDRNGAFESMNGSLTPIKPDEKTASLSPPQGIDRATQYVNQITKAYYFSDIQKKMMRYNGPEANLKYVQHEGQLKLCWLVNYKPNFSERWEVVVSASTGEVLFAQDIGCHADGPKKDGKGITLDGDRTAINTYQQGDKYYLVDATKDMFKGRADFTPSSPDGGVIVTYDAQLKRKTELTNNVLNGTANSFGQNQVERSAVSAQTHASTFYDQLSASPYNFQSLDGKGGDIVMYVNVKDEFRDLALDNAKWEGNYALFGGGDLSDPNRLFGAPSSKSLDVVVHELMHGISHYSYGISTHSYQTRALAEAISDIMAVAIEGNFKIGENGNIRNEAGYLRNTKDPHAVGSNGISDWKDLYSRGYSAKHMDEFVDQYDAGHYNSTIISHAFYLIAGEEQGDGIGLRDAADIFFHVVTEELLESSEFDDFVKLYIKVAENKYGQGTNAPQLKRIIRSFSEVGLAPVIVKNEEGDLPSIKGRHFLFSHSIDGAAKDALVLSKINDGDSAITEDNDFANAVELEGSPSVTDNGQLIYGIAGNGHIYQVDRSKGIRVKDLATHDGFNLGIGYSKVAISSKNERLGLVKSTDEAAIYVYDTERKIERRFSINEARAVVEHSDNEIYELTPIRVGNLEWDYYGTKLIFEYQSSFHTTSGEEHWVWNIGEFEVWDSLSHDFGPGELHIFQQFSGSEVNRRNPAYSKNSTSLFIYDLYNTNTNTNKVIAWNRNGADGQPVMSEVIETQVLAHASYTHTDTSLIITDLDENGKPALYLVDLLGDKVTVQSHSRPIKILGGQEMVDPMWFTMGTRTSLPPSPVHQNALRVYPNPCKDLLIVGLPNARFEVMDLTGKLVMSGSIDNTEVLDVSQLIPGQYILHLMDENMTSAQLITKE